MAKVQVDVDTSGLHDMLVRLQTTSEENKRLFRKEFTAAMREIQNPAKSNLQMVKNGSGGIARLGKFQRYVRMSVNIGSNKTWQGGKVYYMDRKKGSDSFILRFFETGTKDRKTRKGYSRGSILPGYWFSSAADQNLEKAMERIRDIVPQMIERAQK